MDRKSVWILAGAIVLGVLIFDLSPLSGQRFSELDGRMADGIVGRYQVVRSSADLIIIMDTTTGELYKAAPSDINPYNARPGGGRRHEVPPKGGLQVNPKGADKVGTDKPGAGNKK